MNWHTEKPSKSGIYMVLREKNNVPTFREYVPAGYWESNDKILFWAYCPPMPEGYQFDIRVVFDPAIVILDKKYDGFESWSDIDRDVSEMWEGSGVPGEGQGTVAINIVYTEEKQ